MRAARSQRDEDVESEHGRRQHQRQRDERVDGPSAPPVREREPARQRQSDREQDQRGGGRQAEAEDDGRPIHRGLRRPISPRVATTRGSSAVVIVPNAARSLATPFGAPRFGVFSRLNTSARSSSAAAGANGDTAHQREIDVAIRRAADRDCARPSRS